MERGCAMNNQEKLVLVMDRSPTLAKFIYHRLGLPLDEKQVLFSIGFKYQKKLIGALCWTDFRPNHDVWWTIDTWDKHWCTKRVLKILFFLAKDVFHLKRINALTKAGNQNAIDLLTRLGFEQEGVLKRFYETGDDARLFAKHLPDSHGFI